MALNFQERIARQKQFDPNNIGVGGPITITLSCSAANNQNFVKGYDQITWKGNNHEKMPKMREDIQRP